MAETEQGHILEIIPAFALGSLEAREAEQARRHLAGCEICQAELAAYEGVVDVLALAAPDSEPTPALKGRLMERISPAPAGEKKMITPPAATQPARPSWWQQATGEGIAYGLG